MSSNIKSITLIISLYLFVLQGCLTHSLKRSDRGQTPLITDFVCYIKPSLYSAKIDAEEDFRDNLPLDSLELCVVLDSTIGNVKNVSLFSSIDEGFSHQLKRMPGVSYYAYCKMISPEAQMKCPLLCISSSNGNYVIPIIPNYTVMKIFLKDGLVHVHYGCINYGVE